MKLPRTRAAAVGLCLILLTAPLSAALLHHVVCVFHADKLWRVQSNGVIDEIPFTFPVDPDNGPEAGAPVVSPDGRHVAFTKDNDLWLYDLKTGETRRLTRHGRKSNDNFTAVYVQMTAWSADGRQVLYNVLHSDTEDPEGVEAPREVREAPYGYRTLDLTSERTEPCPLAGEFLTWLADGRFLLTSSEADYLNGVLMVQRPGQDLPERLVPVRGVWGQVDASRDGRFILASLGQPALPAGGPAPHQAADADDEPQLTSRIVKIDVRNGAITDVTGPGSWTAYQTPRFSPGGTKISWVRQDEPDSSGFTEGSVFISGRDIGDYPMPVDVHWIDEDTLVVLHANGMDVLRTDGKVIIHRS